MTDAVDRPRAVRWIAAAAVTSALLRLRYLRLPLTVDEAGAVVVARGWDHGLVLYRDVFIDRPQGLVVAYQRWGDLAGLGSTGVRSLAILAGALAVIGTGWAASEVTSSWRAGAIAAWVAAVVSASPVIEGYSANGELLAAGTTCLAVAIAATGVVRRRVGLFAVAGALAALGATVKQSGLDALAAIAAWLLLAAIARWAPRRWLAAAFAWLVLGAAVVLGSVAAHGASLGWDRYAYALFGFRFEARSVVAGGQWSRLAATAAVAVPLLAPALVVAARRVRSVPRATRRAAFRPAHALVGLWFAAATAGFVVGGNYHRHYWVQVAFPAAALAGLVITVAEDALAASGGEDEAGAGASSLAPLLARLLALPLALSVVLMAAPGIERDRRVDADKALARWVAEQPGRASDRLVPLCASVTYYAQTGELPPIPELWVDHVAAARGATDRVEALLRSSGRPRWVALEQPVDRCDRDGRIVAALRQHYRHAATVDGVDVLEARRGN